MLDWRLEGCGPSIQLVECESKKVQIESSLIELGRLT
jgi:hypothetical protein